MKHLLTLLALVTGMTLIPTIVHAQDFRALWVDCEGQNRTLWSKATIVEMLETAKAIGCTDVIVQVYRGNRSWFRSKKADTTPWREIKEAEGIDCLAFLIAEAHERGYVTTLLGRRRYIPELASKNVMDRQAGERVAANTPIQGSAADICKLAMLRIAAALAERRLQTRMLLQVHDELVFELPPQEVDEVRALVRERMENVYPLDVPLVVEVGVGRVVLEDCDVDVHLPEVPCPVGRRDFLGLRHDVDGQRRRVGEFRLGEVLADRRERFREGLAVERVLHGVGQRDDL